MNRVRPWLELVRLSNLPTVWADALVGLVGGYTTWAVTTSHRLPTLSGAYLLRESVSRGLPMLVGLSLMYLGGMVLNDVMDLEIDRHDRHNRPLPSGKVSLRAATIGAVALLALGLAALVAYASWLVIVFGAALLLAIVGYDRLHHRTPWAVFLLGLCRALTILAAASIYGVNLLWATTIGPVAAIAVLYTVLFTIIARLETRPYQDQRRWGALGMIVVVWLALCSVQPTAWGWLWTALAALALALWLGRAAWLVFAQPPRTGRAVSAWIAGFCLADAFYLTLFNQPLVAAVAVGCFALTLLAHRWIDGT